MIVVHIKKRQWRRGSQLLLWSIPCPYFGQTRNLATAKLSKWPFRESKHEPNPPAQSHKVLQSYVHSASKSEPPDQTPRTFFYLFTVFPIREMANKARTSAYEWLLRAGFSVPWGALLPRNPRRTGPTSPSPARASEQVRTNTPS